MTDRGIVILAGGEATRMEDSMKGGVKAMLEIPAFAPVTRRPSIQLPTDMTPSLLTLTLSLADTLHIPVWIVADSKTMLQLGPAIVRFPAARTVTDAGRGTGAALRDFMRTPDLPERLIAMNCDTLVPINIAQVLANPEPVVGLVRQHVTLSSVQNEGRIGITADGIVEHWGELDGSSPRESLISTSSTGLYEFTLDGLRDVLRKDEESWELEILPRLSRQGDLSARLHHSPLPVFDFGTKERYERLLRLPSLRVPLLREMGLA